MTTAFEMFEELARRGVFQPATTLEPFVMPSMLRSVPSVTTYSTSTPAQQGVQAGAGLEERTRGNRG